MQVAASPRSPKEVKYFVRKGYIIHTRFLQYLFNVTELVYQASISQNVCHEFLDVILPQMRENYK
jgi:hypothetical protein